MIILSCSTWIHIMWDKHMHGRFFSINFYLITSWDATCAMSKG